MKASRYTGFIGCFITLLLVSAVTPCGLLGMDVDFACAADDVFPEQRTDDEQAGTLHLDCCTGCLTCCASSTEPPTLRPLSPAYTTATVTFSLEQGPVVSPLSIWRPPRR